MSGSPARGLPPASQGHPGPASRTPPPRGALDSAVLASCQLWPWAQPRRTLMWPPPRWGLLCTLWSAATTGLTTARLLDQDWAVLGRSWACSGWEKPVTRLKGGTGPPHWAGGRDRHRDPSPQALLQASGREAVLGPGQGPHRDSRCSPGEGADPSPHLEPEGL